MSPVNVPNGEDVFDAETIPVVPALRTGNFSVEEPSGTENEPPEKAPPWKGILVVDP